MTSNSPPNVKSLSGIAIAYVQCEVLVAVANNSDATVMDNTHSGSLRLKEYT